MRYRNRITGIGIRAGAAVLALLLVFLLQPERARAEAFWPDGPAVESPSAILMEVNTGTILYEKNADEQLFPASITKIMTTLLAIEYCEMDEIVTFSADAVFKNEGETSHIARDLNEQLTMEQCLYAVMLASANECAYAVAEHIGKKMGGDYGTFVDLMNWRAEKLGCTNTHFNNANGLPDSQHWTSSRDMALIAREAYKHETFRRITGTGSYTIPPTNKKKVDTLFHNHHNMLYPYSSTLYVYDYCTGGKTGYTDDAGCTLVTYAEKNGMTFVCVVMRTGSPAQYTDTRLLMDYYFENFQALNILENETSFAEQDARAYGLLNNNEPFLTLDSQSYIVVPKTVDFSSAKVAWDMGNENTTALATLVYTYAGRQVGRVEIITSGAQAEALQVQERKEDTNEEIKVVTIYPLFIVAIVLLIAFVLIVLFLGTYFYNNFYVIRHNLSMRREQRKRFRENGSKKKRRKKDRLFK